MSPVLNKIWQVAATIPEKRFRLLAAMKKKEKKEKRAAVAEGSRTGRVGGTDVFAGKWIRCVCGGGGF